ncbi:MAG: hypothetical protein R2911_32400 [Caldilineaceae bacterium]
MTLMFTNMNRMTSRFAFMRSVGTLDYYATLPVQRYLVVIASLPSLFLLSLPAIGVIILFGSFSSSCPCICIRRCCWSYRVRHWRWLGSAHILALPAAPWKSRQPIAR